MEPERITPQWAAAHWNANAEAWTARARTASRTIRFLRADAATAAADPYVADTRVAPLFLHLRACTP